ncbi:hypothetical protein ALI144C_26900 [Actinosynnema sp. ALI-1.44]|uniref:TIGR04222 domain-containing membrane protein n=1 Tax=Actinosynnema sp. ALI-1.44 TaxID=1933779 RepID=UPI00097BD3A8|nr:TIGR04222 domain-containing membrane protein [Actinosynnema sp. ALI-1.44]ONI79440.1 hypothetical protein ALI144C_26900 [Actinosynnema sp. ALI-1.44]
MEDTWEIPGPTFIGIYLLGFSVALLFSFAVRILTRSGAVTAPGGSLTALDLACLTGGRRRVVEAAVAQLVETGQLRAARDGYLEVAGRAGGTNPVERTVLADVVRHGRRSVTMLTHRLAGSDSVGEVAAGLVRAGYLVDHEVARHRKLISVVPVAAVFAAGVARWMSGITAGRPIGWLTLVLIGTGLIGYALYRHPICPRTFAGADAVGTAPASRPVELVAVGGFASHPDQLIRASLLGGSAHGIHAASGLGGAMVASAWLAGDGGSTGGGDAGGSSGCGGGGCGG